MLGDLKEAADIYEHGQPYLLLTLYTTKYSVVIRADPTHNDAKMKLAGIYEIMDELRKALDLVLQGTASAKSIDLSDILHSHCVAP